MKPAQVTVVEDQLNVDFEMFSIEDYQLFLKVKRLPEYRLTFEEDRDRYHVTAPARFAPMLGVDLPRVERDSLPIWHRLYDDQAEITRLALEVKRFACWSDCGLGKTYIEAEFARQVSHRTSGGRVLVVTLNEIVPQWIEMIREFYGDALPVVRLDTRQRMREWCATGCIDGRPTDSKVAVTNYEKFNHESDADQVVSELRHLSGFVLDESSRLKTGGGKQKWAVIKSGKGIPYKLSCTATPAPNELMEFASQASFLEQMRAESLADAAQQIIWTYFTRDSKTHRWTVKKHARAAFFEWMSAWSIYVRDPRKYGWRQGMQPPPEPTYLHHHISMTDEQRAFILDFNAKAPPPAGDRSGTPQMFAGEVNAITSAKLSQAAKGFVYTSGGSKAARHKDEHSRSGSRRVQTIASNKPAFVAELIAKEVAAGLQVLVWTVFDEEAAILDRALRSHPKFSPKAMKQLDVLTGKTSEKERVKILEAFRHGESRVLITRADMLGYGMNFQQCGSMVFSGWTFSYEQFYQAVRRAYRDGQTLSVRVHVPVIPELEGQMYEAIGRKQTQHEAAIAEMELNYIAAMKALQGKECAA